MISRLSTRAPPLEAATVPIKNESLYTTFMVYFMDYRPPNISYHFVIQNQPEGLIINMFQENILYSKNVFKINEGERNLYDPPK